MPHHFRQIVAMCVNITHPAYTPIPAFDSTPAAPRTPPIILKPFGGASRAPHAGRELGARAQEGRVREHIRDGEPILALLPVNGARQTAATMLGARDIAPRVERILAVEQSDCGAIFCSGVIDVSRRSTSADLMAGTFAGWLRAGRAPEHSVGWISSATVPYCDISPSLVGNYRCSLFLAPTPNIHRQPRHYGDATLPPAHLTYPPPHPPRADGCRRGLPRRYNAFPLPTTTPPPPPPAPPRPPLPAPTRPTRTDATAPTALRTCNTPHCLRAVT